MCLYFNQILKHKPKEPSLWFAISYCKSIALSKITFFTFGF